MKQSEFFGKFKSWYLWGNLLAMFMVVLAVGIGVRYGLDVYTHHGESIEIPNVKHRQFADAEQILKNAGLKIEVVDTGYVKSLPANCILEQSPAPGEKVKSGHVITVTINASHSPTITLPDVIDNSSLREAMAKLSAMGFKLGMPQYIAGEKDWVDGILVKGRHVVAGDRISVEETLIIQVGNGLRDGEDSVDYIDPVSSDYGDDEGDIDDFEEVPEAETSKGDSE
jgi:beta-lactam-binding protein with PASTA domain